ncbi:MAG TPA: PepSY domain-containing protein [Gemmataceae bacterium]|nr:PepSY domain-containing protein [Gemmataceae bacterium]
MSGVPPSSPRPASMPWWLAPTAIVALAAGAVAAIWAYRDTAPDPQATDPSPAAPSPRKFLPDPKGEPAALHSVTTSVENGVRVWKIKVTPGGDELIVDAATGRLLETRPGKPAGGGGRPMIIAR